MAAGARLPLTAFTIGRDLVDAADAWRERYGVDEDGAVLVRPDGHVAWRSARAASDPAEVLAVAMASVLDRPNALSRLMGPTVP